MRDLLEWGKDQKAMEISFEELQASIGVRNNRGDYNKALPMKHADFIEKIADMVSKDYDVTVGKIYVPKNRIGVVHELDPEKKGLINASMFRSLIGEIHLNSLKNDEMNMKLAINITERGVTLAQGTNVQICSNMTIMGASNMISTMGRQGLPFDKFTELFNSWVPQMGVTFENYVNTVEQMKSIQLGSNGQIQELIGELQIAAIRGNYEKGYYGAPLNLSELSRLTQDLIKKPDFLNDEPMSLWDIFNDFTYVQTHSEQNIDTKIEDMIRTSEFLLKKYYPESAEIFLN